MINAIPLSIVIMRIKLKQRMFWFFKRTITISIHYRINQDRFWYDERLGFKVLDSHHTKKSLEGSIDIMNEIIKRLEQLKINYSVYRLKELDGERYEIIKFFDLIKQKNL